VEKGIKMICHFLERKWRKELCKTKTAFGCFWGNGCKDAHKSKLKILTDLLSARRHFLKISAAPF